MSEWYAYEAGQSIGRRGSENGVILRDDEYGDPEDPEDADARITLERVGATPEYAITCGVYGWMFHTRFFESEEAAQAAFDLIKPELERLAGMIPYEEDRDVEAKAKALGEASADFVRRHP